MEPERDDQDPIQEEVRQLMELLRVTARALGFNNAALARRANVPIASMVRYFKGEGEPKLEFLLAVVRAVGLEVREFFELAYPEAKTPTPARVKMGRIFGPIQPGKLLEPPPPPKPEPKPEPLKREDIEKMMEQLRKDVRAILEKQAKKKEPPPEPEQPEPPKKNGKS